MDSDLTPIDQAKFVAARSVLGFFEDGMRLGLGARSTAASAVGAM